MCKMVTGLKLKILCLTRMLDLCTILASGVEQQLYHNLCDEGYSMYAPNTANVTATGRFRSVAYQDLFKTSGKCSQFTFLHSVKFFQMVRLNNIMQQGDLH